MAVSFIRS